MESEAMAARSAFCEVLALKADLSLISPGLARKAFTVHEDNQSLIAVVNNVDGGRYEARKHIAIRVMFLREIAAS